MLFLSLSFVIASNTSTLQSVESVEKHDLDNTALIVTPPEFFMTDDGTFKLMEKMARPNSAKKGEKFLIPPHIESEFNPVPANSNKAKSDSKRKRDKDTDRTAKKARQGVGGSNVIGKGNEME